MGLVVGGVEVGMLGNGPALSTPPILKFSMRYYLEGQRILSMGLDLCLCVLFVGGVEVRGFSSRLNFCVFQASRNLVKRG